MKFLLDLLLMVGIGLFLNQIAHADEFRLIGKGVASRTTGESIALACVDANNCHEVQFVYFNGPGAPEWLGPRIELPTAATEEMKEAALQLKIKKYMATNAMVASYKNDAAKKRNIISWAVMIGFGGAAMAAGPMTLGAAAVYFVPIAVSGLFLRAFPPASLDSFLVQTGEVITVSQSVNRDGWSWSSNPKPIGPKKFERLLSSLRFKDRVITFGGGGDLDRVIRKMSKMEDQGVDFKMRHGANEF